MAISWKAKSSWMPGGRGLEMDRRPVVESEVDAGF